MLGIICTVEMPIATLDIPSITDFEIRGDEQAATHPTIEDYVTRWNRMRPARKVHVEEVTTTRGC